MAKKKYAFWVVTASMWSTTGNPLECFSKNGEPEKLRQKWIKFPNPTGAQAWVKEKGIQLNGNNQRILLVDFPEAGTDSYQF